MDDFESPGHLDSLADDELRALIARVTSTRPALRDIHDAAAGVVQAEVLPDVDPPMVIGQGITEPGFTEGGVPTFDSVRERITGRAGTAAGQRELDSPSLEEQVAARDEAGRRKLDEIRKSMQ
ncbi:hypothetical protein GCM10007304_01800 [Rhodococcoides trifolii]|uniref:PspA domain-containing protein n=1 Tax=Rhodococcoides trifolii TaxID=908250 RepID=A0A917FLS4_9NOCA|nr:hypothetical protein [Rhodococcus trifolii]GGF91507.1 hypothetical protein GCM10007304_01800 [Rhodococcus trifolii]